MDGAEVGHTLSSLVASVLTRLAEQGVPNTLLEREWEAITGTDGEEAEYCLAAARLGLDPYSEAHKVEASIIRASEQLSARVFDDFMDAVDPDLIDAGLDWLRAEKNKSYTASSTQRAKTRALRREMARWEPDRSVDPGSWGGSRLGASAAHSGSTSRRGSSRLTSSRASRASPRTVASRASEVLTRGSSPSWSLPTGGRGMRSDSPSREHSGMLSGSLTHFS